MVNYNMDGPARDRVMRLMEEKDRIESEIRAETAVLVVNNVGMDDPLVDIDGFPRADIDVYKVRHARHRIICLQNDHKSLMKMIEEGLNEAHLNFQRGNNNLPAARERSPTKMTNGHAFNFPNTQRSEAPSFAVIEHVQDGSPADIAGLRQNDQLLQFGSINHNNFSNVNQINSIVQHSVGQRIQILVRRNQTILSLAVVPKRWEQPGLLGCHITRLPA
ncbi:unnamed protein product, partial [Iphiclides podalirius]